MRGLPTSVVLAAMFLAACGLTEGEQGTLASGLAADCPQLEPAATLEQAARQADLVVEATSSEGYFVDGCHRAFVMDVSDVLKGTMPEVLLVVVRVDPSRIVDTWEDLGYGASSLLFLEPDPDIPDAWRPVSDAVGIASADDPEARQTVATLEPVDVPEAEPGAGVEVAPAGP